MDTDIDALVAERLAAVNKVYIATRGVKEARELINRTRAYRRQGGEAYCCFLWGPSGVGKSRILENYLEREPEPKPRTRPVLYVKTPSPFSQAAFGRAFLRALGRPVVGRHDLDITMERVVADLKRLQVEVILLDEISHVTDHRKRDGAIPYWVTDSIKMNLLDEAKVTVVMTGIEAGLGLLRVNSQLQTRYAGAVQLTAYDVDDPKDFERMRVLLAQYERAAKFSKCRFPADEALGRRMHAATGGINGPLALLAKRAIEMATRRGLPGLTQEVLAEAFASLAEPSDEGRRNPFLGDLPAAKKKADESRVTGLHPGKKRAA